jgi:hypothetical protein
MCRPLHPVKDDVIAKVARFRPTGGAAVAQDLIWPAMLRKLDRLEPTWRS